MLTEKVCSLVLNTMWGSHKKAWPTSNVSIVQLKSAVAGRGGATRWVFIRRTSEDLYILSESRSKWSCSTLIELKPFQSQSPLTVIHTVLQPPYCTILYLFVAERFIVTRVILAPLPSAQQINGSLRINDFLTVRRRRPITGPVLGRHLSRATIGCLRPLLMLPHIQTHVLAGPGRTHTCTHTHRRIHKALHSCIF